MAKTEFRNIAKDIIEELNHNEPEVDEITAECEYITDKYVDLITKEHEVRVTIIDSAENDFVLDGARIYKIKDEYTFETDHFRKTKKDLDDISYWIIVWYEEHENLLDLELRFE